MIRTFSLLFAASCTFGSSTMPEYDAARTAALAPPPPLPEDWKPDGAIVISTPLMDRMIDALLPTYGRFTDPIDVKGFTVKPDLRVTEASVTGSGGCSSCLAVDLRMKGTVEVSSPIRVSSPVDVTVGVDLNLLGKAEGPDHVMLLSTHDVRTVEVQAARLPKRVSAALSGPLAAMAKERLVNKIKPLEVVRLESTGIPVLAVRPAAVRNGIRIDLRTAANSPTALVEPTDKVLNGYAIVLQKDSMLDLARKTSMEQGVVTWDVVPEPTMLDIGRDSFTMHLRLWRITGSGWWRDYEVKGAITREGHTVHFAPAGTKELGASPGASLADPISEIGRSEIIKNIDLSITGSLDTQFVQEIGDQRASLTVDRVYGSGEAVFIAGDVSFSTKRGGGNR